MNIQENIPLLSQSRKSYASIPNLVPSQFEFNENLDLLPIEFGEPVSTSLHDTNISKLEERKWRCIIERIEIDNNTQADPPFIKFLLGGPQTRIDEKKNNYDLKPFQTSVAKRNAKQFPDRFCREFSCSYASLSNNYLTIELYQAGSFCSTERYMGFSHISLRQLVDSSTKQTATFRVDTLQGKQRITGRIFLRLRFEEILFVTVQLHNWQGMKIPKDGIVNHEDISSLPFRHIVFRIGNNPPSKHIVSANPQFPRWKEAVVVSFRGTEVSFRNSVLLAVVYASSSPDNIGISIGYSALPLISISQVPFVRAPIVRDIVEDVGEKKNIVAYENVGTLEGYLYLTSELSLYHQINAPRTKRQRHIYMVVTIDRVTGIPPGIHDNFLIFAYWREYVLHTKSYSKQGNMPVAVDEQLHFPLHSVELSDPNSRWRDGELSLVVYDCPRRSEHCRTYVGGFGIGLREILDSNDVIEGNRVYKGKFKLFYLGKETQCEIVFTVWFEPDIPNSARHLDNDIIHNSSEIDGFNLISNLRSYEGNDIDNTLNSLEMEWKKRIPSRFLNKFENRYFSHIPDERGKIRFLPTYLVRFSPSPDYDTPQLVEKMVQRIKWTSENDSVGPVLPSWTSPNCLIQSGIAGYPAEIILHANLLLGLGLDTYVCVGNDTNDKACVWVMTRDDSGGITFWLTNEGSHYTLQERWQGVEIELKTIQPIEDWETRGVPSLYSNDESGNPSFDFYPDDPTVQPYEGDELGFENIQYDNSSEEEYEELKTSKSDNLEINLKRIFFVFNHQNIWANIQLLDPIKICFDLDDKCCWIPFFENLAFHQSVDSHWGTPFYTMKHLSPPLPRYLSLMTVVLVQEQVCSAITRWREKHNLYTEFDEDLIPYLTDILQVYQKRMDNQIEEWEFQDNLLTCEGKLDNNAPAGCTVTQSEIRHFKFFDPVRVSIEFLEQQQLHVDDPNAKFTIASLLIPYHNNSCSLWVGIVKMEKF